MKFQSVFKYFHSRKCTWTCRLRNGVHFVSVSMCSWYGRLRLHYSMSQGSFCVWAQPMKGSVTTWRFLSSAESIPRMVHGRIPKDMLMVLFCVCFCAKSVFGNGNLKIYLPIPFRVSSPQLGCSASEVTLKAAGKTHHVFSHCCCMFVCLLFFYLYMRCEKWPKKAVQSI